MNSNLTEHQTEVFEAIVGDILINISSPLKGDMQDHFLSLSGAAGVGKSFVTAQIVKSIIATLYSQYQYTDEGIYVTAPTHKAVKVIRGMLESHNIKVNCRTIQSFLGIKPVHDYKTGEESFKVDRTRKNLSKASLLIVDESSMVSQDLYRFLQEAFLRGQVNTILFIGDKYQLLPVSSQSNPVFDLKKQYRLTQIVRQAKDSNIIKLANKFRDRLISQDFVEIRELIEGTQADDIEFFTDKELFIEAFHKNQQWYDEDKIITSYSNKDVEAYNKLVRDYYWHERGLKEPQLFLPNDKVRFKSSYDRQETPTRVNTPVFSNGEEATIKDAKIIDHRPSGIKFWECSVYGRNELDFFRVVDPESIDDLNKILEGYIQLAKTTTYPQNKSYWKMYFNIKSAFADVQYIYASTVHKLQGSTYNTAYIDLASIANNEQISSDLKYRLAYVAITRASKNLKILF